MTPKTILVTGGAGFVGSNLALHLKRQDPALRVVAFDNLRRRGSELNLQRLKDAAVEFIHGDIREPEDLDGLPAADVLLECSAEPSVLAGVGASPAYLLNTNLVGTLHLLEYCRRQRARMVFLSTSRVYPIAALCGLRLDEAPTRFELAAQQDVPGVSAAGFSEGFPLEGARSLYGATKLASELFITEYADAYGLETVVNRCGVIAGPWQMGKVDQGFVVLWLARHVFGGALSYIGFNGSGKQVRDVLHIDDLCDLVTRQLADFDRVRGQLFNVGGGRAISVSLRELTELAQRVTGKTIPITPVSEMRPFDIPLYLSDSTKLQRALGWKPSRGIERLVDDTYAWLRDHAGQLAPILGA
ncbi:MAG TPA: NAD-dependent epimerase/dehydratase family protein [Candidatus Binatia bacterium]|nr:NAD-dependent epimerase/dehydratase family protein [Candidatus Binatia bacterium]